MKKFLLVFLALGLICELQAQKVNFGITSAITLQKLSAKGFSSSLQEGYKAGIFADVKLKKRFSLQPEILFQQQIVEASSSFKTYYPETAKASYNKSILQNYLSLPIILKYQVTPMWSVGVGPQYSYMLSSDDKLLANGAKAFNKSDVGALGSVQVNLASIRIYGRYYYGCTNRNEVNDYHKWTTSQVQFGVGLRLF